MRTIVLLLLLIQAVAWADVDIYSFDNVEQEQRYKELVNQLRCLVCQNQSLADSNAELARDLRDQTYKMIREGRDDDAIIDYMVSRYGDFVLYDPPLKSTTLFLWAGPFLLLLTGLVAMLLYIRRQRSAAFSLSDAEKQAASQMLNSATDRDTPV